MDASVGDVIEVHSAQVGQTVRRGTVLEKMTTEPLELRVQWADGHESVIFPSGGMVHVVERHDT